METDGWIKEAMSNDVIVVELLMRLKEPQTRASPLECAPTRTMQLLPLQWGMRQRRSKSSLRCAVKKPGRHMTRCSPTTPLISWSADTASPSATANGGSEDSSRLWASRSKASPKNESVRRKQAKRKSFSKLKRDEIRLLKERVSLRKEIAALTVTVREQRTMNERLKRMKQERVLQRGIVEAESGWMGEEAELKKEHEIKENSMDKNVSSSPKSEASSEEPTQNRFLLPDLNFPPPEAYLDLWN